MKGCGGGFHWRRVKKRQLILLSNKYPTNPGSGCPALVSPFHSASLRATGHKTAVSSQSLVTSRPSPTLEKAQSMSHRAVLLRYSPLPAKTFSRLITAILWVLHTARVGRKARDFVMGGNSYCKPEMLHKHLDCFCL